MELNRINLPSNEECFMNKKLLPEIRIYTNVNDTKYALFEQSDVISDVIREEGFWNKNTLLFATNILKKQPKGVVVDVGSGFGPFSIPLACTFGDRFDYVAFEPLKVIFMQLATNVFLNNLSHISIHNVGLSNKNEKIVSSGLDIERNGNHGAFSFNEEINALRNIPATEKKEQYEMRTLDSYNLSEVRFVKLAAAGMESEVLEGAKETLIRNNLPPVVFEYWGDEWYKEKRELIFETLRSFGYGFFENVYGYVFAFKEKSQFDFYTSEEEVVESGSYVIGKKVHVTQDTLENQKVFGQEYL